MLLTELTPTFLRQWRDRLSAKYAPGTVRRYMDALSGPLTVAVKEFEWIAANPLRKVRKPAQPPGRVRCLREDERQQLLAACKRSRNPHLYSVVVLALATGARKNELLQLRWRDIDLARGVIRLARTKNGQPRVVPLVGQALELLQARWSCERPEAWVFARADGLKATLVDQAWEKACQRAGLVGWHLHDLRHTCASFLAMSGASLRDIAEVLGHKNIQMSLRYAHLTTGHTEGVLQRMAERFLL